MITEVPVRARHVDVSRLLLELSAMPVRSFRISSFSEENTFTTFEMTICIRVSTNNYKLSLISLMHRNNDCENTPPQM